MLVASIPIPVSSTQKPRSCKSQWQAYGGGGLGSPLLRIHYIPTHNQPEAALRTGTLVAEQAVKGFFLAGTVPRL